MFKFLSILCLYGKENYFKSVHQPIPTRENWEHPGNFQNKSGSSAFNWVQPFYFLKWNCYFWACKRKFLESTSPVFPQILHQSSVPSNITRLYIIYFGQKQPVKVQIFEIFECWDQNVSNSSCQIWTHKLIPLQIWYHSSLPWHKTPL